MGFPEDIQSSVALAPCKQAAGDDLEELGLWSSRKGFGGKEKGTYLAAITKQNDGRDEGKQGKLKRKHPCESGQLKSKQLLSLSYQIKIFWFSSVLPWGSVWLWWHSVVETPKLEGGILLPLGLGSLLSLLRSRRGAHCFLGQGKAAWEQSYFLCLGFRFFRCFKASSELLCLVQCD